VNQILHGFLGIVLALGEVLENSLLLEIGLVNNIPYHCLVLGINSLRRGLRRLSKKGSRELWEGRGSCFECLGQLGFWFPCFRMTNSLLRVADLEDIRDNFKRRPEGRSSITKEMQGWVRKWSTKDSLTSKESYGEFCLAGAKTKVRSKALTCPSVRKCAI